jgi:hypothetical protein
LVFLGQSLFGRENTRQPPLDFLGFPWILSSESSIFNGLREILAEKSFRGPFAPWSVRSAEGRQRGYAEAQKYS